MKPGLKRGVRVEHLAKVRSWMRPHLEGRVRHPLYATWAMVYHMELAARKVLVPFLEPNEEAVGAGIVLEHIAPAPVATEVRIVCIVSSIKKGKVYCHLDAYWKNRKIGRGSHVQAVISRRRFQTMVYGTSPRTGPSRN